MVCSFEHIVKRTTSYNNMEFHNVINNKILKRKAITSYGLIVYTVIENKTYYLLGKVRDTISFKQFINMNISHDTMRTYLEHMAKIEKERLIYDDYENIVNDMIMNEHNKNQLLNPEYIDKFNLYKQLYVELLQDDKIGLDDYPYIFPKGRKKKNESELNCAIREFEEETKISSKYVEICNNIDPIEETYFGLDGHLYRTIYYTGHINSSYLDNIMTDISNNFIQTKYRRTISDEISKIKWLTYNEATNILDNTKQYILKIINNYILISPYVNDIPKRRYSL